MWLMQNPDAVAYDIQFHPHGQTRLVMITTNKKQRGISLIEMLVGLTIGLLVVLAAFGTIVMTKSSGSTVADTAALVSQGDNAMRQMAFFIRQAGAVELIPMDPGVPNAEQKFNLGTPGSAAPAVISGLNDTGSAAVKPDEITVWQLHRGDAVTRDCLGAQPGAQGTPIPARFFLNATTGVLSCQGLIANPAQPVAQNVVDLQFTYLVETGAGTTRQWLRADQVQALGAAAWNTVVAVETCMEIRGEVDHASMNTGNYVNCNNATVANTGPMRLVLRNTVQLRNRTNNL